MDQIFDRLGNLLKSILQENEGRPGKIRNGGYADPDLDEAWRELDDFLKDSDSQKTVKPDPEQSRRPPPEPAIPEGLRRDFANLEVEPGASMEEVSRSYKRLLGKYHPDRHAGNPERFETATRVTQMLTESYRHIREHRKSG